jgi:hypothetical protein
MSSYVAPLVNAGISGALVYVPAYQLGYSAFQTSLVGLVVRVILSFIPGASSFLQQTPSTLGAAIPEGLIGILLPLGLMYFKFGISGVGTYILVGLIPMFLILVLAGAIVVAASGQKKKH